jgi:hypothetical protein
MVSRFSFLRQLFSPLQTQKQPKSRPFEITYELQIL